MFFNTLFASATQMPTMFRPLSVLALLYLTRQALAHEHHTDEIPEGEAISAQPIVYSSPHSPSPVYSDIWTSGYYIMDPHCLPNSLLWRHLPNRNGPRGTSLLTHSIVKSLPV